MRLIRFILKACAAGIAAAAALCILLSCYSLMPVHTKNPLGNTDYVWPANSLWMQMDEGVSLGRFDAQGFNNAHVIDHPDVLILGSSHMEATQVMQDETASAQLQSLLGDSMSVYNMGISSHNLPKVCQYLPQTLSLYDPAPKTVFIETSMVALYEYDVQTILDQSVRRIESHEEGLVAALQKLPFFRALYQQIIGGLGDLLLDARGVQSAPPGGEEDLPPTDGSQYDPLMTYLSELEAAHQTELVIFCHPKGYLQDDGSVFFAPDPCLEAFSRKCAEHGIGFIDMAPAFYAMYESEQKLPHGFITGEAGSGHLNRDGHRAIAKALYQYLEGGKEM